MCYDGYQICEQLPAPGLTLQTNHICSVKREDGCMKASQHRIPPNMRGMTRVNPVWSDPIPETLKQGLTLMIL